MSYSDDYRDQQRADWLHRWTPDGIGKLPVTEQQVRYLLAKTREQEATIKEFVAAKAALRKLVR